MPITQITTPTDLRQYDHWVKAHPQGTLWQSLERKTYIEARKKEARIYVSTNNDNQILASALVVVDSSSFGLQTWDIPRGPLWLNDQKKAAQELLNHIVTEAKERNALALYYSPLLDLTMSGSTESPRHIHCEATRVLDLTVSENDLLAQMKPKGRYNIRVANKKGVTVEESDDIDAYYALATETGSRDGFTVPSKAHLRSFLHDLPGSFLLLAMASSKNTSLSSGEWGIGERRPIAGLLGVIHNNVGIYYYGASSYEHRALMAPYALQWHAIKYCKQLGCHSYDLLGIAPRNDANHPWAGITNFKEKFGGEVITHPREQMVLLRPITDWLLRWKRRILP